MNTLKDLVSRLYNVNREITGIIKAAKFDEYDDLSGLNINYDDPEERFLLEELREIMGELENASRGLSYLARPITGEYTLHKNSGGRYECSAHEYSSGNGIEFYYFDEYEERYSWAASRVEHDGNDYYIVGHKGLSLEGLRVRRRG